MEPKSNTPHAKRNCVVIDTNIWQSEHLLNSPIAATLVYTIARQECHIGLPEVIELELETHIVDAACESAIGLAKYSRQVETWTGKSALLHSPIPTRDELGELLKAKLDALKPILIRIPFTLEHARAALGMLLAKLPPNGLKNQQFKDSAIWRALLDLCKDFNVHFVTADTAFYQDKTTSKGLVENLKTESAQLGRIDIWGSVADCLKAVSGELPSFDRERLESLIVEASAQDILRKAEPYNFQVGKPDQIDIKVFTTEQPNRLAVDYTIIGLFESQTPAGNFDDGLFQRRWKCHGSCYFNVLSSLIYSHMIDSIMFRWTHPTYGSGSCAHSLNSEPPSPFRRPIRLYDE